jgi:hypothetical protein
MANCKQILCQRWGELLAQHDNDVDMGVSCVHKMSTCILGAAALNSAHTNVVSTFVTANAMRHHPKSQLFPIVQPSVLPWRLSWCGVSSWAPGRSASFCRALIQGQQRIPS